MKTSLFVDEHQVSLALAEACDLALNRLARDIPGLSTDPDDPLRRQLLAHLHALVTGHPAGPVLQRNLPHLVFGDDVFGDEFSLAELPLPRPGSGYAVQQLDTDTLLDRHGLGFLPVRDSRLSGLFTSFAEARDAARDWLKKNGETPETRPLAIVPATYDEVLHRHILIYGVLTRTP